MHRVCLLVLLLAAICVNTQILPLSHSTYGRRFIGQSHSQKDNSFFKFGDSQNKCCERQIFTMSGFGEIEVAPDIANLQVSFEQIGKTSQNAIQLVNGKVNNLLNILKRIGIAEKDISTNSLNVFPRFNFVDGNSVLIGQAASQSLTIKIRSIGPNGSGVGPVIDAISGINGIIINGINFDLEDKTKQLARARKAAFTDASEKAKDYADFSKTKVGGVLKIQDFDFQVGAVGQEKISSDRLASAQAPTTIIADNLKISTSITVLFAIVQ